MRTELDHLPPAKQRELDRVVQILFEEFDCAVVHRVRQIDRFDKIDQQESDNGIIVDQIDRGVQARAIDRLHHRKAHQKN